MARPWFELEEEARKHNVVVFSSNYELYAEMSNRFMATLWQFTQRQEVYSIDESFLEMTGIQRNLTEYGQEIKTTVKQWTRLPICVGFGYSKTQAITFHATNAAQRMRKQHLSANAVFVFIQNSPFDQAEYYCGSQMVALPASTDCTLRINHAAQFLFKRIYRPDTYYQKAGVMLMDLVPNSGRQTNLFGLTEQDDKSTDLMEVIDRINQKYERGAIKLASEGIDKTWAMRRSFKSPNYLGDWKELPKAK